MVCGVNFSGEEMEIIESFEMAEVRCDSGTVGAQDKPKLKNSRGPN